MPDSSIIISTMPIGGPMVPAKSGGTRTPGAPGSPGKGSGNGFQ